MSKTLTLVERLRERETAALADAHRSDIAGSGEAASLYDDEARFYDEIASALEAAQKALEPFAKASDTYGASTIIDRMAVDRAGTMAVSDLRLARSVHSMLIGEDETKGDIKEANHEG